MNVFVTNRSDVPLTIGYNAVMYEFKKNVPVEIPYEGAVRLFGYEQEDKEPVLVRFGWIKLHSELEEGLKILSRCEITTEKPHSSQPAAVGVVPLRVEKHVGGKSSQRAA